MFKILITLLIGFGAGYWCGRLRFKREEKTDEKQEKVLELIRERGEIANDDVQQLLGVSDATATRYLDKLEKEGKIRQVGSTGRHVKYEKI